MSDLKNALDKISTARLDAHGSLNQILHVVNECTGETWETVHPMFDKAVAAINILMEVSAMTDAIEKVERARVALEEAEEERNRLFAQQF